MNSLRTNRTGYKPDGTLPLINIVLLLVLAFMMAGTFEEPVPSDFNPLRSEVTDLRGEAAHLVVLTMDVEGAISLEGRDQTADELARLLDALGRSEHVVEVRADARASAVQVIALLSAAERAGIKDVQIVTLGRR